MKRKKTFMLLLILLVMVASGVMYAAVNGKNLVVNGYAHAKADDANFDVRFVNLETTDGVVAQTAGHFAESISGNNVSLSADGQTATFHVVFNKKGTNYLILKIKNLSPSLTANVKVTTTVGETTTQNVSPSAKFAEFFEIGEILLANALETQNGVLVLDEGAESYVDIPAGDDNVAFVRIPITLTKDVTDDIGYDGESLTNDYSVTVTLNAIPVQAS